MGKLWMIMRYVAVAWLGFGALTVCAAENVARPQLVVQTGHADELLAIAVSPDGRVIASGGKDDSIKLWDLATGRLIRSQRGHGYRVSSLTFSSDSATLISGSDKSIKLWDIETGNELRTLLHNEFITSISLAADNKTLLSVSNFDNTIIQWNLATGREVRRFTGESAAMSPDGKTLVTANKDFITLWNAANGNKIYSIQMKGESIKSLVFSRDGKRIAAGSYEGEIGIWNAADGKPLMKRSLFCDLSNIRIRVNIHEGYIGSGVESIDFSPDGKTLLGGCHTGFQSWVVLWDLTMNAAGEQSLDEQRYIENISKILDEQRLKENISKSADGKTIKLESKDKAISAWLDTDIVKPWKRGELELPTSFAVSVAFSPDGKSVFSAIGNSFRQRDRISGEELRPSTTQSDLVSNMAYFPNSNMLAAATQEGKIILWDIQTGKVINTLSGHDTQSGHIGRINHIAFSPDGETLVSAGEDKSLKLWAISAGRELKSFVWHGGAVTSAAFSPNGKMLVSGSADTTLKLWDVSSGKEVKTLKGHTASVKSVCFSPDGRTVVSVGEDKIIKLWNVASGKELLTIKGQNSGLSSVTFSPDGRLLASGGDDGVIKLWDVGSGKTLQTLTGHKYLVEALSFSTDGRFLLSTGGWDKTIRIWDVVSGREQKSFMHEDPVSSAAFSSDGETVVSGTDRSINFWRVSDGGLLASLYSFQDHSWVVVDSKGRFDTSDLEEIKGLHWIVPEDPLTPLSLEFFMKEYYEPRLLPRILNGEKFKAVAELTLKNPVQPEVRIVSVVPDARNPQYVNVTVEVSGGKKLMRRGKLTPMTTGVHDLRVFRDGQMVAYVEGKLLEHSAGAMQKRFHIRLPGNKAFQDVTFSAYAFNDDGIKSRTEKAYYHVPGTLAVRKGNAYLIHIGVNQFDNPDWNLQFAANDARLMRKSLSDNIKKVNAYQNIVSLSLISDGDEHHADKALFHAILDRLAGKSESPLLRNLSGAEQLQPATPDDLVLITFSGHGYADGSGNFYLLTQDTGKGNGNQVDEALLKHSISSEELSQWLRDVDAGDMTLIIDACQSAASVQGKDFKPGPMGSRGLGQLSFDKGMRILAASQSDEFALEHASIKQGLLSYALVKNGLEEFAADREPKDGKIMLNEWLHYGVDRVPVLANQIATGEIRAIIDPDKVRGLSRIKARRRAAQQPALFDFVKNKKEVEVADKFGKS